MRAIDKDGAITYRITGRMRQRREDDQPIINSRNCRGRTGMDRDESCNVRIFEIVDRYLRVPALDEYGNFTRFIKRGGRRGGGGN